MGSLSNLYISQSYISLIHLGSDTAITTASVELQDGLGNGIGVFVNSLGDVQIEGQLSASNIPADIATQAELNAYTASTNARLDNIENTTASLNISVSNINAFTSSQNTKDSTLATYTASVNSKFDAIGGSTASLNQFTASNGNTSLNSYTASQDTKNSTLSVYTASVNSKFDAVGGSTASLNSFTSSQQSFNASATASIQQLLAFSSSLDTGYVTEAELAAATASLINQIDTKLNTSSFNSYTASNNSIVGALVAATASYAISSSVAAVDYEQQQQINALIAVTASFLTSSSDISSLNAFTASQETKNSTLASVTASLYNSVSSLNSFTQSQDVININLSASASLNIAKWNNISSQSGSWITESETGSFVLTSSFNAYTQSQNNVNLVFASELSSLEAATSSYANSASVAVVDAAQQSQINALIAASGSYLTSSVSLDSLNAFTASQDTKNSTLENVTSSLNAYTSSNSQKWNDLQIISGTLLQTASFSGTTIAITKLNGATNNLVGIASTGSNQFQGNQYVLNGEIKIAANAELSGSQYTGTTIYFDTTTYPNDVYGGYSINANGDNGLGGFIVNTYGDLGNTPNIYMFGGGANQFGSTNFVGLSYNSGNATFFKDNNFFTGNISVSGSTYINNLTASLQQGYVWVGAANGKTTTVATSSFGGATDLSSLNAFTASQNTKNSTLASVTASLQGQLTNIGSQSASWDNTSLNTFTSSADSKFTEIGASTSSLNSYTASQNTINTNVANSASLYNAKFDNIAAQSGSWVNVPLDSLNAFTASQDTKNSTLASVTASLQQQLTNIGSQSGSWITESETGSFAYINKDNAWSANQTFTNITAVSASFQYVQTTYETSSVIYSSGSNQFGDAADDVQTLYGSTRIVNELTASGLHYPTADGLLDQFLTTNGAGQLTFDNVKTLYQNIRNRETSSIIKGTPLFVSGATGDNADVYIAEASNPLRFPATLIAGDATLASNAAGRGIVSGEITGVDTSAYSPGTVVYLGGLGGWTATRPTGSATQVQILGVVTKQNGANGGGLVMNQLGTELPNIQQGYTWVGNGDGTPIAVATSSFASLTDLGPLNAFTASQNTKNSTLATYTASVDSSLSNINGFTQSIVGTNPWTASVDTKFATIATQSGSWVNVPLDSLNAFTASQDTKNSTLANVTASLQQQLTNIGSQSGSWENIPLTSLNAFTQSIIGTNPWTASIDAKFATIATQSGSWGGGASIPDGTVSSSAQIINYGIFATTGSNNFVGSQIITGQFDATSGPNRINLRTGLSDPIEITSDDYINILPYTSTSAVGFNLQGKYPKVYFRDTDQSKNGLIWNANGNLTIEKEGIYKFIDFPLDTTATTIVYNKLDVSGSVSITGSLTASLQEGYVWAGGAGNITKAVATSSFSGGTINTASFATTGSNNFTGNQNIYASNASMNLAAIEVPGGTFPSGSPYSNVFIYVDNQTDPTNVFSSINLIDDTTGEGLGLAWNSYSGLYANSTPMIFANQSYNGSDAAIAFPTNIIEVWKPMYHKAPVQISGSLEITGSAKGNVVSMSISSNTASMDFSKGNYFELTASVNPLRINVTNLSPGTTSTLSLSGSTASTITFSSNVLQPTGSAYTASVSGQTDILSFVAFNSSKVNVVSTLNMV